MFLRLLCVSGLRYFGVWGFDLVVGVCACRLVGFLLFSGVCFGALDVGWVCLYSVVG